MRYWDASAIVPLFVDEPFSASVRKLYSVDSSIVTWWGSEVECLSALCRLRRENSINGSDYRKTTAFLVGLSDSWTEIGSFEKVKKLAARLLRVHPLRAADALQLAAALVAADGDPRELPFVCRDERLAEAADKEGFSILG